MHNGARTNNYCEGYNYKLGAKKMLHKHPNVYILVSSIRDELIVSQDNALVQIMGGAQKQGKKKYEKLRERQEKMMKHYAAGNTDLYTYQLSMGAMSLSNSKSSFDDGGQDEICNQEDENCNVQDEMCNEQEEICIAQDEQDHH